MTYTTICEFRHAMQDNEDYLKLSELKDNHSYQLFARNAYAGVWSAEQQGFWISRYKMHPEPFLFLETHWDIDDDYLKGTAKLLKLIEACPFDFRHIDEFANNEHNRQLLNYLDKLEESNPVIAGHNTVQQRRDTAIRYVEKQKMLRAFKAELDAQGISIDEYYRQQRAQREKASERSE